MEFLTIEKINSVAVMKWRHQDQNRFHTPFMTEVIDQLTRLAKDDSVTGVVVTSRQEKIFTTGLYLEWMLEQAQKTPLAAREFMEAIHRFMLVVTEFPKPIVAAINGHAVGLGVVITACMDFRLMRADYGFIRLPEVHIDIPFWPGMTAILREVMPEKSFREMTYTGDKFTAENAHAMGFIDRVCAPEELLPEAIALAAKLGKGARRTYATIKKDSRSRVLDIMKKQDPLAIDELLKDMPQG
jgi:enoyl-CoA hydratase/carnithine racemase